MQCMFANNIQRRSQMRAPATTRTAVYTGTIACPRQTHCSMTTDCLAEHLQMGLHSQDDHHVAPGEGPEGKGQGLPLPEGTEGGHMPLEALMH